MIKNAISSTVYIRLVTTTSIVAKLAVCAILLAAIGSAHAAKNDGSGASDLGAASPLYGGGSSANP